MKRKRKMTFPCREKDWKYYFKVHTMLKSSRRHRGEDVSCPDLVHWKSTLPVMEQGVAIV